MENKAPERSEQSTAMVTAGQYSAEIQMASALPALTKDAVTKATELSKELIPDEEQLDDIVTFGSDVQIAVSQITKEMLRGMRVGALDDVLRLSDGVLAEVHSLDVADLLPAARPVLVFLRESAAAIKRRIRDFFRRYESVNTHLDRQEADIFAKEAASTDRYHRDRALAKSTLDMLRDAQIKATAIQIFLNSDSGRAEHQRRLQAVRGETETSELENRLIDYVIVAAADRYGKYLERLEAAKATLQQVTYSAYQMHLTIRMMSENENVIRQKLYDIRTGMLPQWRTLIAIAYQAYQQQEIGKLVADLRKAEADLRQKTGDQLEKSADEMARMMTQPVIDVPSMKYYQDKLVNSLDKLKIASVEASKIRNTAETQVQKLISDMDRAVAATTLRKE